MNTLEVIEKTVAAHPDAQRDKLIPILQDIQQQLGYIPRDAVAAIGTHLNLPSSKIYGVATFYNQFRFSPPGRYHIQVCRGTACHVKGSHGILERLQRELEIKPDQTTRDGLFSLEVVACMGACGLSPVISVNGTFHGNITSNDVPKILDMYRKNETKEQTK